MKTEYLSGHRVSLVFGLAISALVVVGLTSYRAVIVFSDGELWLRHTHQVLENIQDIVVAVESVDSDYRSFAVTGDEARLALYRSSALSAEQHVAAVRELTKDNPVQQSRVPAFERLVTQETRFAEKVIDLRRARGAEAAEDVIRSGEGDRIMAEFARSAGDLQAEDLRLLAVREADAKRHIDHARIALISGTILGLLIAIIAAWLVRRDSSRRGSAERLLDREQATSALLDLTHDAIIARTLSNEIVFWGRGAESLYGWSKSETLGRTTDELLCTIFPKPSAEIEAETIKNGCWEGELSHKKRDGSSVLVSSRWSVQKDGNGQSVAILESNRDISLRRAAEEHLAQMEGRYRGLMEAAPDAMVVVNQAGDIVLLNLQAEKQFGYRRDELIGQPVRNIIPEGFAERLIADGARSPAEALAQQIGTGIELVGLRKDSSRFPIEIMLSPLENADGILVTAAIRDISVRKAAEEHLAQMEGRYRGLMEAAPDAMVVVNQAGDIVLLNLQAEKQFGYRRDELIGQQVRNIIPEGFAERLIADGTRSPAEALAQQIGTGIELVGLRKDSSRFPIEIMLSPLENADGILVTAAIRDISVRKAAEEHLAQMEGRYRGLMEAAPDAMVVVNQAGDIVLLNLQAEKQFGYRRDELIGQPVRNIIPEGFAERLIADGTRSPAEALAQQIGTGIELVGLRKDSSRFPIEIMLSPLENSDGILVTAAVRDITERKHAEEALRQSEERLRLMVASVRDYAILMLDTEGNVTSWNDGAERIKGYRADEIIGRHFSIFYSPEDIAAGIPNFELKEAREHGHAEIEGWRIKKDGSRFLANTVVTALRDERGTLRGFAKVSRDITERRNAEERLMATVRDLKRSNSELSQFANVASHDLQEPLRMVASYTQLLAKRYEGRLDSDADEFIAYAVDGCNRMQRLIEDLLTYSRAGANVKMLSAVSAETSLKEALSNLRIAIEESGAVIRYDPLPTIATDGAQLVQVFQNLIGNAIKYRGPESPCVHISAAEESGNMWKFSVKDNGLGIEPQYFERIFVLFQRLHGRTEFEGTGIGLAICKKIVERLGGNIWVESQPEKGSSFFFTLPKGGVK